MQAKDLENQMLHNNVCIVGLLEKVEGSLLNAGFGRDVFTPLFFVEQAHRTPNRLLPPGRPPRPILGHLLNNQDREIILHLAHECQNIQYNCVKASFYPDFSAIVQCNRV